MTGSASNTNPVLQPTTAPVWTLVGLFATTMAIFLVVAAKLLVILFPLGAFSLGVFLYRRYPAHYVGFTWWMWFLAPFVRRLIDYRCGYFTPGTYTVTALLVTAISLETLIRYLPRVWNQAGLPFILCIGSVLYAFAVRIVRQPILGPHSEFIILLQWLTPLAFAFYLFIHWPRYPAYRDAVQRTFLWAVIVMGLYGVLQFLLVPPWDRQSMFWTLGAYEGWMGKAEPLEIRVWSTMDTPFTFAVNMLPGLILLLLSRSPWRFVAAGVGYLSFLLTQHRTAWYSWAIALVLLIPSLKGRHQFRMLLSGLVLLGVVAALATQEPFSTVIHERLETFANLAEDGSGQSRLAQFQAVQNLAMTEVVGFGFLSRNADGGSYLGFSGTDMGGLQLLISLGWLGTIPYILGLLLLFLRSFQIRAFPTDTFAIACRVIAVASFLRIATTAVTYGDYAMPVWGFLGMAIAAYYYHLYAHNEVYAQDIPASSFVEKET